MRSTADAGHCLNCGTTLHGAFCAACGQRSVPADPSVSDLARDAWQELSGYDGRIASTFRALLIPGRLTIEYLRGRRARYLSPVRLYLIVSVIYFLAAALAPGAPGGLQVRFTEAGEVVTPRAREDRAAIREYVDTQQWWLRPTLSAALEDPAGFRARLLTIMPRVFFAMLPVFAAVVALFYRQRKFPTALVFAVHLHAFAFLIFTLSEAAKATRVPAVMTVLGLFAALAFMIYALRAFRAVFGGGWPVTIAKAIGIGFVYMISAVPAFAIILVWASLT